MKNKQFLALLSLPLVLASCGGNSSSSSAASSSEASASSSATPSSESSSAPSSSVAPSSSSSSSSEEPPSPYLEKDINIKMVSHFGEDFGQNEIEDTCFYSDRWFLGDSYQKDYGLALASAYTGGMSYATDTDETGNKIASFLEAAGYSTIQRNRYYAEGVKLQDSLGVIVGKKAFVDTAGKEYTLLAVFPRNAGYGAEWKGDFNLGTEGMHKGFQEARDEMLRFTKYYIDTNRITGNLKIWSAGYSRGAASASLFGGYLADNQAYLGDAVTLSPHDLYVYTIGTPNYMPKGLAKSAVLSVSGPREKEGYIDTNVPAYAYEGEGTIDPTAASYDYIHNFAAVGDYVTKMPSNDMGFFRYGQTEDVVYGSDEMREELKKYSASTADSFAKKNFATEVPVQTVLLREVLENPALIITGPTKDTERKQSADAVLNERIDALLKLGESREDRDAISQYLGNVGGIFGVDGQGFADGIRSSGIGAIVKTVLWNYLAYSKDKFSISGAQVLANILTQLFAEDPASTNYTDQQFLSDLLDYLINDYQTAVKAQTRAMFLKTLIPAPYGQLYLDVLDYAKTKKMTAHNFDDLFLLLSNYITDNKNSTDSKKKETVLNLVETLAKAIPENYRPFVLGALQTITNKDYSDSELYPDDLSKLKAEILDTFECCVVGSVVNEEPKTGGEIRYMFYQFSQLLVTEPIWNLISNGAYDGPDTQVEKDPVPLADFVEAVLSLVLPKKEDNTRMTIEEAANQSLSDLILSGKTEKNGAFVEALAAKPETFRSVLFALLFNSGEEYNFQSDVDNAYQIVTTLQFVFPAHSQELYISYLKTKLPRAVQE
ncbi:MAG: hypothetical protein IJU64_05330 [Bacilli bacterium]|nr:hypothetical protein [Bacilli bacterium]